MSTDRWKDGQTDGRVDGQTNFNSPFPLTLGDNEDTRYVMLKENKNKYGKCVKISNTFFNTFLHLLLKILSGMANSVDHDKKASLLLQNLIWI